MTIRHIRPDRSGECITGASTERRSRGGLYLTRERELKLRLGAVGLVVVHVAPHAGARIEIYKTRSGRHERKIAPHALTVPHFWALRAVQMCTVFATECCVYSGLLYGNKWDGDTAPTRNTALVGGFFHRTVAGKAKPAGWRALASVLCVVIGSVVARRFIFPAGRAASTRFFRGFACGW